MLSRKRRAGSEPPSGKMAVIPTQYPKVGPAGRRWLLMILLSFAALLLTGTAARAGEADLAIEQLDLLLAMPDQPVQKSAEWLARSAVWQLKYRQDPAAARVRLEQLVREFPQTSQAFAAQRRLNLMEMEERIRKARSTG